LLYDDLAPLEPKKADDAPKEVNFEERLRGSGRPTKRERRQTDKLKPGH
jgi:ribosome-associated heat shock protein Hsp15